MPTNNFLEKKRRGKKYSSILKRNKERMKKASLLTFEMTFLLFSTIKNVNMI